MAKRDEADERWIVKDREDGRNCNNWHWVETNLTNWSEKRLKELLKDLVVREDARGFVKVVELEKMKGDVTVQSRKQKKFPLYELELVLTWKGEVWGDDGKAAVEASGKIKIPDLSEETYDDDMEMTVLCDDETGAKRPLKEAVRTIGVPKVRGACQRFVKELKESVGKGAEASMASAKPPAEKRANAQYVVSAEENKKTGKVVVNYHFNPPPHVLYESLLDTDRIRGMTASDATMSKEVGGSFSMFSGAVEGTNIELKPFDGTKAVIKWKWRFSTWPPGHHSTVTITLEDKDGSTDLKLVQLGVPEAERERTEKGWGSLLFDRLKAMLGGRLLS